MSFAFDCSHYQGQINWRLLKDDGCVLALVKTTQGTSTVDSMVVANHAGAAGVGIPAAPYHFSQDGNAAAEAANFAKLWKLGWQARPWLDEELSSANAKFIVDFRATFRADTGVQPFGVYAPEGMLAGSQLNPKNWLDAMTGIWAARYAASLGWDNDQLLIWQFSSAALIAGIVGHVDQDEFMHGWTPGFDAALLTGDDMALTDPLNVKRPDGSVPTLGDAVGNMYLKMFYPTTSPPWDGPSQYELLKQVAVQQAAMQGSLTSGQAAVLAAIQAEGSGGAPTDAQVATQTQSLMAALDASVPKAVLAALADAIKAAQ